MEKTEQQNNARLSATKNDKGYIKLELTLEGYRPILVDVSTFNGKEVKKAKQITYALYCKLNGVK